MHLRERSPVRIWDLPISPFTIGETVDEMDRLIAEREPRYVITANLNYAMLTARDPRLREVNEGAAFLVADGMPLVWASRLGPHRLPERVAGADLIWPLCRRTAEKGHRIFILGGPPGVPEKAGHRLREKVPTLQVAGTLSPPFREWTATETQAICKEIRAARPDILFVCLGQPRGELWMAEHHREIGAAVSIQVGAAIDFVAGNIRRAPIWIRRAGLEWAYRVWREPRRLAGRYVRNGWFLLSRTVRSLTQR